MKRGALSVLQMPFYDPAKLQADRFACFPILQVYSFSRIFHIIPGTGIGGGPVTDKGLKVYDVIGSNYLDSGEIT